MNRLQRVIATMVNIIRNCLVNVVLVKSKYNDITCHVPKSTTFRHYGIGIIMGDGVKLGNNCVINHNVTIGGRGKSNGYPIIEDNVRIYTGACILGNIRIGHNSVIGANAVVIRDVKPYSLMVGVPAKVTDK